MTDVLEGGCRCGAIRYRINASAPLETRICHCRDCQYASGGAFAVVAFFARDAVSFSGATAHTYTVTGSMGLHIQRGFCPHCGTPLFSAIAEIPALLCIKTGSLDQPGAVQPDGHMWCASKLDWVQISDGLPQLPGNPPLDAFL
jgi:hypothetical protein